MAVLGHSVLRPRLAEIFSPGTFTDDNLSEASYNLRIARDGLLVSGKWYPVEGLPVRDIRIGAGEIALLSTEEQFTMAGDLVGIVNIRFKSGALRGLTLVFGSRVDPGYGRDIRIEPKDPYTGQRLYLVVYNISDEDIPLRPGDSLFMVEFHTLDGKAKLEQRDNNDTYMAKQIENIVQFGFLAGVGSKVAALEKKVVALEGIQGIVKFVVIGVMALVTATLLGVLFNFATAWMASPPKLPPAAGTALVKASSEGAIPGNPGAPAAAQGYVAPVAGGVIVVKAKSTVGFEIGDIGVVIRIAAEAARGAEERYVASSRFVEKHGDTFIVRLLGAHGPIRVGDVVRRAHPGGSE